MYLMTFVMFVDFWVPPSTPWSMCLPQVLFPPEKTRPWIFGACVEHVWIGQYLENFVVIRTGGTRIQGLGEPPGTRWGNRWAGQCEGIPY